MILTAKPLVSLGEPRGLSPSVCHRVASTRPPDRLTVRLGRRPRKFDILGRSRMDNFLELLPWYALLQLRE